ncbi:MAG: galactokinase family protein, partial [Oscillospiraceae bacterium]|nr:galactokinase family protein [Oscillospiraceae bacterium]
MTAFDTRKAVLAGEYDGALGELYADLEPARRRFANALTQFAELFGDREVALFSAPGRTEIGGNHTDHQRGAVLAAAVNRDVIAIAAPNSDHIIRVQSKGYKMDVIDLNLLEPQESERESSPALVRGVAARFKELGLT